MKTEKGTWQELICMLFAALVGGLVFAWVVGDAIWRDKMNAIVREREANGETFIYVMGEDGPKPWKHEPDGCGACKLAEQYWTAWRAKRAALEYLREPAPRGVFESPAGWATWRSEHGAPAGTEPDGGGAPRTAGGSPPPSKGEGEGARGVEGTK